MTSFLLLRALYLIFFLFFCGCGKQEAVSGGDSVPSWSAATVDSTGDVGIFSALAVDGNGKAHIVYNLIEYGDAAKKLDTLTNVDLKYATNASGSWETTTLDSTGLVGIIPRITGDSNNKLHIVYTDGSNNKKLKYGTNSSGNWVLSTINDQVRGTDSSISVDSDGKIHISYFDEENSDLKYVTNKSGSWTVTTIDSEGSVGADGNIAVDTNNNLHISYLDKTKLDLKYATNTGGSWVLTTIDSEGNVGWNTSIAIDKNGKVHISYSDPHLSLKATDNPGGNGYLKYATNKSGSWSIEALDKDNAGYTTSLAVDQNGAVHLAYYVSNASTFGKLKYITNSSGSWVGDTADSGAAGLGIFDWIALDPQGVPQASYYDYGSGDLKFAKKSK